MNAIHIFSCKNLYQAITLGVEGKGSGRKILAIFSVVIAILAVLAGFLYYSYITTVYAKDAQILALKYENDGLKSNVSALTNENQGLKERIKNLTDQLNSLYLEKSRLESVIKNLTDQYNALTAEKSRLEREIEGLNNRIKSLTDERARLLNDIKSLTDQVNSLTAENNRLKAEINDLRRIVNLQVRVVLDRDKTVNIPANRYIILTYSTPYAGYIRISFTATQAIFIWVGSSFTGSWYSQINGTFGDFIVPVLPGTTSIYISNPSLFFGVTVTLTIEYVY
jgi:cell division protein FtsB